MREGYLLDHPQAVPAPYRHRGGRPLTHPVHGKNCRVRERRRKKRARRVAQVMFREQQLPLPIHVSSQCPQLAAQDPFLKKLLLDPQGHRDGKRTHSPRRKCQVRFQQALELQEWLLVEHHQVQRARPALQLAQTVRGRPRGKRRIVPDTCESFLLRGSHHASVLHQGGGTIVIKSRDPQHAHGCSEQRIDERRHHGVLGQQEQGSKHQQHRQDGDHPQLLAVS